MKSAEVIAIGDEMISGARLDTNSQWLTQQLALLGIETLYHTTVGDDISRKTDAFRTAASRADLIVCTGGLGPTADDLTRQVIADLASVPLELDQESMDHIESLFIRRGRTMRESNRIQAYFPQGAEVIGNREGTAPGFWFEFDRDGPLAGTTLVALPGVPAELKEMWSETVARKLLGRTAGSQCIRHRSIHCFGAGESEIEQRLPNLVARGRTPRVGITASKATITLRITATADDEQKCLEQIGETERLIHEQLGDLVFGYDDNELQDVVCQQLRQQRQTLGIFDYFSAGLIGQQLLNADQTSHSEVEIVLGCRAFPPGTQAAVGLDSGQEGLMKRAASEAREMFAARMGIALFGPADPNHPRAVAWLAVDGPLLPGGKIFELPYSGHPSIRLPRCLKAALNELRLMLLQTQA